MLILAAHITQGASLEGRDTAAILILKAEPLRPIVPRKRASTLVADHFSLTGNRWFTVMHGRGIKGAFRRVRPLNRMPKNRKQKLDHVLLVLFKSAEQPKGIREFFRLANAFEFGAGIWLVPIAADPDVCLNKILEKVPTSPSESVVVMSLARFEPPVSIHNYPELLEWFQSARKPDP
jgi:hypothetical protein